MDNDESGRNQEINGANTQAVSDDETKSQELRAVDGSNKGKAAKRSKYGERSKDRGTGIAVHESEKPKGLRKIFDQSNENNGHAEGFIRKEISERDLTKLGQRIFAITPKGMSGLHSQLHLTINMLRFKYLDRLNDEELKEYLEVIGVTHQKYDEYISRMQKLERFLYGVIIERLENEKGL